MAKFCSNKLHILSADFENEKYFLKVGVAFSTVGQSIRGTNLSTRSAGNSTCNKEAKKSCFLPAVDPQFLRLNHPCFCSSECRLSKHFELTRRNASVEIFGAQIFQFLRE